MHIIKKYFGYLFTVKTMKIIKYQLTKASPALIRDGLLQKIESPSPIRTMSMPGVDSSGMPPASNFCVSDKVPPYERTRLPLKN